MQASRCVAYGAAVFALQWHRTSCVVHEQLRFSGGVTCMVIANRSEGLWKLWWGLFSSCHKALFLLGLPQVLLAWDSWWYLLSRDRCLPSWVSQCVNPTSPLTNLQVAGRRFASSCCTSASGCISPKRSLERALHETFVLILNFFSLYFKKIGNDRIIFYYLLIHLITGYQS